MAFLSTEAYVIRWYNLSEGDRFFRFFSRTSGLIKASVSHKTINCTPPLQGPAPFDRGCLTLVRQRQKTGLRLIEYQLLERNIWLAEDPDMLGNAMLMLEAIERLSPEEDPQQEIYGLIGAYLGEIKESRDPEKTTMYSFLKLFRYQGYEPVLEACRICGKPPEKKNYFEVARGGFVHERCKRRTTGGLQVSPGTLRFLQRLRTMTILGSRRINSDQLVRKESFSIIESYLNYLCQQKLNSQVFRSKLKSCPGEGVSTGEARVRARRQDRGR